MNPPFLDHCAELLGTLGTVRTRRMFGGWGLYADGTFVALIVRDRLYLKTDEATRDGFAAAGCEPFVHTAPGRPVTTSYWSAPPAALESAAAMAPWARDALGAALRARAGGTAASATARSSPRSRPSRPRAVATEPGAASAPRRPRRG